MKQLVIAILAGSCMLLSCNTRPCGHAPFCARHIPGATGPYSQFVTIDSADKMLQSYLNSINSASNDSDLQCVIINADSLRAMLNSTATPRITNVKLMFAHTLNYINNGGQNQPAGYQSKALTLIIAGYDASGNYQYRPYSNKVLDMGQPCPNQCVASGTAKNDILP